MITCHWKGARATALSATRRARRRGIRAFAASLGLALAGAMAAADPVALRSAMALRVEHQAIPRVLAEDLLVLAQRERPSLALSDLLQRLALEWLLGEDARRRVGDAQLFASRRVAFSPQTHVERQWQSLAWQRWPDALAQDWRRWQRQAKVRPAGDDVQDQAVWRQFLLTARDAEWPGRREGVKDALLTAATRVELLRWCADEACRRPSRVTLDQVWPALNVQGRTQIVSGDRDFARAEALRWLQDLFTRGWAAQPQRWGEEGVSALDALLWARIRWQALVRWEGLDGDAHGAAAGAETAHGEVSDDDITRYWREHPDEFRRISRLDGWRARCTDESCRAAVEPLVRRSGELAPLASQRIPGLSVREVRWSDETPAGTDSAMDVSVLREGNLDAWSLALMGVTPVGVPSSALRHPGVESVGWEWVQVQRREERLQPVTSETVRYGATQALLQQRRQQAWRDRQEQLLARATLQWAPDLAAPQASPLLDLDTAPGGHHHD